MVYIFSEHDLEWKFFVTAENVDAAIKLLEKELEPDGYNLKPQEDSGNWRVDIISDSKLIGTFGVAEYPFEMHNVYA